MQIEYWIYLAPALIALGIYVLRRHRQHQRSLRVYTEAREAGLVHPASLHPVIDPLTCIGCGSCLKACPEQEEHHVLGLIQGEARLVAPADCIGHGACKIACPVGAIQLVFGTAERGVDIPKVSPWFETNVAGIFVAGELGGMGLIRNAIEQGRQAVEEIYSRRPRGGKALDVLIVGAGPAGFSASLAATERRMRFVTIEQESLGGCVYQYPRGKIVMTQPARLPMVGSVKLRTTNKEELLELWRGIERTFRLKFNYRERVETIQRVNGSFEVQTTAGKYLANSILLAIGRRGTPRKLGVEGEELPKVTYRLIDPEQYAGQRVLVVGGGDSALEAASSIAEVGGSGNVVLSYRGDAFGRAKAKNRDRIAAAERGGRLKVMLNSQVAVIDRDSVTLKCSDAVRRIANDSVIVSAGGILPTEFLRSVGIEVETKFGTA